MTADSLSAAQMSYIKQAFHRGAEDASAAMAQWLAVPSVITIESVDQSSVADATGLLGDADDVVCFCVMAISGSLTGHLILAFDEASGLSLADLLFANEPGTATEWGDVEQSAALESHNIIGSAYLNSLARHLAAPNQETLELLPSPPEFRCDFAECLLQAVYLDQAAAADLIFTANARFEIRGRPLQWTLLLVPDAPSMQRLRTILPDDAGLSGDDAAIDAPGDPKTQGHNKSTSEADE